ncbi:hypothetical protein [Aquimarina sediminis]|uniref:hypothetical protein n=1 Tax=Aquimarina sediminis TaxID=2070536 RepID=UPI001F4DD159|nr:hypothetical protein [Aquimarina sediminis]
MKNHILKTSLIFVSLLAVGTGCKQQKKPKDEVIKDFPQEIPEEVKTSEISLEKLSNSPTYTDASLVLDAPEDIKTDHAGEIDFSFKVKNYELGSQTASPNAQKLANSGKGQHIHFILNNKPYSAHYETTFKKEIPEGEHHLVAFLSRSYHESVKNENSVITRRLVIGNIPSDSLRLDMKAPTLIYSRPKGEYTGKDTEQILLDFFVLNTTLSEDDHKVRAVINDKEFIITEWVPYVIKGLPIGEVIIQLELQDSEGKLIPGPFNKVERKIMLKE